MTHVLASSGDMARSKSCLLANTSTGTPANLSSCNNSLNSYVFIYTCSYMCILKELCWPRSKAHCTQLYLSSFVHSHHISTVNDKYL